jgi:hypothetical protein
MQFVSLKENPIVDYLEFYRNKFPQAFKVQPEDDEEIDPSDWEWQSADYEKKFSKFDGEMDKVHKSRSAIMLLQSLNNYREIVKELPVTNKKGDCTILRFYLYLLPIVNLAYL